jgi:hypothetical protein
MATFTIPQTTLPVGTTSLGPFTIADSDAVISTVIDRTVPGGLNSLTSATLYSLTAQQSNDGGATWHDLAGDSGVPGGLIPAKGGGSKTQDTTWTQLNPGTSRQVRAQVIISGPSSITFAGSVTTS